MALSLHGLHYRQKIRVYFVHSISNYIFWLKIYFYPSFQFNLLSNSMIRFWILKDKSIMEIQFLKWKLKIRFSIFNIWKQKFFLLNPVFNKKFEIQITSNLKNEFPFLVVELTSSVNQIMLFLFCFHCSGVEIYYLLI